jgi:regulator of cell morphogenesis and NO signaling
MAFMTTRSPLKEEVIDVMVDPSTTVKDLALTIPNATRVFEKARIDYCCGGNRPLADACTRAGVEVEAICRMLTEERVKATERGEATDFQSMSLTELANYIVEKHHVFTRQESARLVALLEKVCSAHADNHPELLQVQTAFGTLQADLDQHMFKEEQVLFPYIKELEAARSSYRPAPRPPFVTMRNPLAVMTLEHDAAGDILREICKLSKDFAVPADACLSYQTLYSALEEFEVDLHQHIHLENNILFPRALALEDHAQAVLV